jgi:hypothetical protein
MLWRVSSRFENHGDALALAKAEELQSCSAS